MRKVLLPGLVATSIAAMFVLPVAAGQPVGPVDIGSRWELFVDGALIEQMTGQASLRLHHPAPRELSLTFDRPWEGSACGYVTVFRGRELVMNYSTSGAGSIRVEVQNADGRAVPGFSLEEAEIMFGDSLQQPVLWKGGSDVSRLSGKPVRLRFEVKDADLYSIRFRE